MSEPLGKYIHICISGQTEAWSGIKSLIFPTYWAVIHTARGSEHTKGHFEMKLPKCTCQHRFSQLPAPSTCTRANSRQHSHPHSTQGVSPKTKPSKKLLLAHAASWSTTSPLQPHVLCATGPAQQQPPCGWWKPEQSAHPSHPSAQPAQLTAHTTMQEWCFQLPRSHGRKSSTKTVPRRAPRSSPLPQAPLQTLHLRHLLSSEGQVIASKQEMQKYSGFLAIKQKQPLEFALSDPAAWQVYG